MVIDLLPTNITEHKVKDLQYTTSESMQLSTARLDIKVELRRAAKKKMNNLGPKCWTTFHVCISTAPKREAKGKLRLLFKGVAKSHTKWKKDVGRPGTSPNDGAAVKPLP